MPDSRPTALGSTAATAASAATVPPFEELRRRSRKRSRVNRVAGIGVAAALVLAAGGAFALLGGGGQQTEQGSQFAAGVPWAPLPPTHPTIPTHRIGPAPSQGLAGVRPCKPQQLHLEAFQDGAGGQFVLSVLISSRSTCRLAGFGQLAFNIGGKQVTVPQQHSTGTAVYRGPVLVNRKPSARATFYWPTLTCGRASRPGQVLLSLPGDTQTIPAAGTVKATPVCDNGTKAQVTAMSFEPTHRPPAPHRESAWAGTKVRLHVPARTSSGAPLAYTVALAPRHTIDLRPCPDFTMALSGAGTRPVEHRYGLNCRGVNREHPRWHGAIPAGQTVRFTMREVVPPTADGPQKVFWKLEVPDDVAAAALTKATP